MLKPLPVIPRLTSTLLDIYDGIMTKVSFTLSVFNLGLLSLFTWKIIRPFAQAQIPSVTATHIRTTLTSSWSPPSPDPSGIAFIPAAGMLLISDGEVD